EVRVGRSHGPAFDPGQNGRGLRSTLLGELYPSNDFPSIPAVGVIGAPDHPDADGPIVPVFPTGAGWGSGRAGWGSALVSRFLRPEVTASRPARRRRPDRPDVPDGRSRGALACRRGPPAGQPPRCRAPVRSRRGTIPTPRDL